MRVLVIAVLAVLTAATVAFAGPAPEGSDSCVIVEIHLRQREDLKRSPAEINRLGRDDFERERRREVRTPLQFPGVVVGEGEILIPDPNLEVEDWGDCYAVVRSGRRVPIRPAGMLRFAPGVLLTGEAADLPRPVKFVPASELAAGQRLMSVWIWRRLDRIVTSMRQGTLDGWVEDGLFARNSFPFGALILTPDKKPVGVSLNGYLYLRDDGRTTFAGLELLKMPGIPHDVFQRRIQTARDRLQKSLVRVKLEYRLPAKTDGYSYGSDRADDKGYGLAIGNGRVFFPIDPGYQKLRRLARVVAIRGEGGDVTEVEGKYLGSFRNFAGVLLEFGEIEGVVPAEMVEGGRVERFGLVLRAEPERKFGKDTVRLRHSRYLGDVITEERGRERKSSSIEPVTYPGRILVDLEGRVRAIVTKEKYPDAESGGVHDAAVRRRFYPQRTRVFWNSDLAEYFAEPNAHFDERAQPRSRQEAKRGVWLGVEFQYLNEGLARELEIQNETRDGELGMLVSHVYEGSPAESLGIVPGDLLLWVLESGKTDAERKELLRPGSYRWRNSYESWGRSGFSSRSNELTTLLTGLGEGKKVVLAWLKDGEEKRGEITLAQSPPDFKSAPKWECEPLGITVKDLTYEVRAYFRLPKDFKGVIVADVESGSPAQVGEIYRHDILKLVNGEPVPDVASFRALATRLLDAKTPSLTFFVKRLTGTRFIEVRPNGKDAEAAEGEGKDADAEGGGEGAEK